MGPLRCQHCAEHLPYEAFFCSRCGRPLEGGGRPIAARHSAGHAARPPQRGRRGRPALLFFLIFFGVMLFATATRWSSQPRPAHRAMPRSAEQRNSVERRIPFRTDADGFNRPEMPDPVPPPPPRAERPRYYGDR